MSHVRAAGLGAGLLAGLSLLAIGSASAQPGDGRLLPPGFEGRITYEGRYSGTRTNAGRATRRNPAFGASSRDYAGSIRYEVTYGRSGVRATFEADGVPGELSGTRNGATCDMVDRRTGATGSFRCDAAEFSGVISSPPGRLTYRSEISARATTLVGNAPGLGRQSGLIQGQVPRGLRDFYSGKLRCSRGEKTVRLRVLADGRGTMTIYPPAGGIEFDVRLIEASTGTIRIRPASRLKAISYIVRRSGAFAFGADLRRGSGGLYGLPSEPDCSQMALIAHSSAVPLTGEQFNRLAEMALEDALLRKPDLSQDCGGGLFVARSERCPGD